MNYNVDIQPALRSAAASDDAGRLFVNTLSSTPHNVAASSESAGKMVKREGQGNAIKEQHKGKKARQKKRWKKPKDKPSRPLSAYNLFFQAERSHMLGSDVPSRELERRKKRVHCKTHGKIGFAEMARAIGAKWKSLEPEKRKIFEDQAMKEKKRYTKELADWKSQQKPNKSSDVAEDGLHINAPVTTASELMASAPRVHSERTLSQAPRDTSILLRQAGGDSHAMQQFLEQRQQNLEYLCLLQDRQIGCLRLEASTLSYPSAAEASANALLQHFQGMYHTLLSRPAFPIHGADRLSQLVVSPYTSPRVPIRQMQYMVNTPFRMNNGLGL